MSDDFRVTYELPAAALHEALARLKDEQRAGPGTPAGRVVASADDDRRLFLYADSEADARAAAAVVDSVLAAQGVSAEGAVERWHDVEERWEPASVPLPADAAALEQERARHEADERARSAARSSPDWEVRIDLARHRDAVTFAKQLESEGIPVVRRWRFLLVGANTEEDAIALAERLRAEAPPGAKLVAEGSSSAVRRVVYGRSDSWIEYSTLLAEESEDEVHEAFERDEPKPHDDG
jgi:hypothetical protein